jgi:UDP-N-acetylglucosamine 4,6-dehydratase/5-epimerase
MDYFSGKTLMITGGTGSFGSTILNTFLKLPVAEIRIYSRDEKKQEDQRIHFGDDRIKYYIGDVRDLRSLETASRGVNFIYHAAALKQVPSCEFHPMEAVNTNVLGTNNVLDAAIGAGVERVVCLSTDKAVYPINAMGISKALMEKVMVAKARSAIGTKTTICGTRYGNVLASRGSVVPLFMSQIEKGLPLTLTDPEMTRFVMTLDQAVDLVLYAFEHGENGDIFVQKAPAVTIETLARATAAMMGQPDFPLRIIGTRHGEKLYETLLSREEMAVADDQGEYYRVPPDNRDLNYDKYTSKGDEAFATFEDFNSHNTRRMPLEELSALLTSLPYVREFMAGRAAYDR